MEIEQKERMEEQMAAMNEVKREREDRDEAQEIMKPEGDGKKLSKFQQKLK